MTKKKRSASVDLGVTVSMDDFNKQRVAKMSWGISPDEEAVSVIKMLKQQGLIIPKDVTDIDEEFKFLPSNISSLSANEIMDRISVFTSLFGRASWILSIAKSEVSCYEREVEMLEAKYYSLADGGVTDKRNERDVSQNVVTAKENLVKAKFILNMTEALVSTYDKSIFVLSRQLTVLQMEHNLG